MRVTVADVAASAGVSRVTASKALHGVDGVAEDTRMRVLEAAKQLGYRARHEEGSAPATRVTIADVAREAGLSKGTASFALNNQPGIAPETRERVRAAAKRLGWRPHSAARALSASEARAVGVVLARDVEILGAEPFFMQLIAGIESVLGPQSVVMLFQTVPSVEREIDLYERWWSERRVDGVILSDLRHGDPRLDYLDRSGIPAVVAGLTEPRARASAVYYDEDPGVDETVRHLAALGHQKIGRIGGRPDFVHTTNRGLSFEQACRRHGIRSYSHVDADYSMESGARATREFLQSANPPTALVYDNDIMALAGLREAKSLGIRVPDDLSVVAWDDSLFCEVSTPAVSAVSRDIRQFGSLAAVTLLRMLQGGEAVSVEAPPGTLIVRDSTAPARRRG